LDLPIKILFCDFAEQRDTSAYLHTKFARGQGADLACGFFALPHLARPSVSPPERQPHFKQGQSILEHADEALRYHDCPEECLCPVCVMAQVRATAAQKRG
jgi:hypothetical protein